MAMAQFQLKQTDTSRANLKECEDLVQQQLRKLGDGILDADWRDWIIVHALLDEARSLIQDRVRPVAGPAEK
jgi:chaperonin GroEL (HSP60 family)